jgi:hypothetical protein
MVRRSCRSGSGIDLRSLFAELLIVRWHDGAGASLDARDADLADLLRTRLGVGGRQLLAAASLDGAYRLRINALCG